ncbi:L-fuculose-phosphate aldolase [Vibrio sp. S4M6]|uniref:L-fuculose-phosphate aldolase n=1 Tax=Vibrio sinus TaxID=2946865 RepID=UPI00202A9178|nr:L-fuculose-phosphate aldolase [Vibrio sinus]MCL9780618.1 L-fuculose-phosphate aldolase [Vibrio sinus]
MYREQLSQEIIDACLEMNALGINHGSSGNVSARYENGMLITPSGAAYSKLSPNDIVFIDEFGNAEAGKLPSSEWHFHLACYQSRPELNAVVHTHAVNATAVAILNRSIPPLHYMVAVSGSDHIPCIPYSTFGTPELARDVAEGMKQSKAILMQHHGMIAMEANLEKALWLANEVEVLAKMYLTVSTVQTPVPTLSKEEMDIVLAKFTTYGLKQD